MRIDKDKNAHIIALMTPESQRVGRELRRRLQEQGESQRTVADRFRVNQSRVSRVLAGDFTGRSTLAASLCRDFNVRPLNCPDEAADRAFQRVTARLRSIWDGTTEGASALAQLIETVRSLQLPTQRNTERL